MTVQTENVLQKLFSENSVDNIPLERLKQITEDHPYFTLGHLLLAKKLQSINAAEYESQSEKTSIYFNEPIWLQTLLHPPAHQELVISEQRHHEETPELTVQETVQEPVAAELSITEVKAEIYEEQVSSLPEVEKPDMKEDPQEVQAAEPVATEEPPVVFEPYHTIDYFASQGIRISNEIKPDDPLGQRLKSFTEWLKTMKRLPQTRVDEQLDEVTQQNIQDFASHSLDEKEVVTETMAEVLVKQHKEEEAVVIYEKLSLLNPSKRAYFAAKIEQLKGQ
jgi:hypothetical protein